MLFVRLLRVVCVNARCIPYVRIGIVSLKSWKEICPLRGSVVLTSTNDITSSHQYLALCLTDGPVRFPSHLQHHGPVLDQPFSSLHYFYFHQLINDCTTPLGPTLLPVLPLTTYPFHSNSMPYQLSLFICSISYFNREVLCR